MTAVLDGAQVDFSDPLIELDEPVYEGKQIRDYDPEEIEEFKRVFALFDHQGTGHVKTEDLGTIVRGLGYNVTEAQLSDFVNANDHDGSGNFDFADFYRILVNNRPLRGPCREPDVLEHFLPFDIYKDGHITAEDLFNLLHTMGEPMPEEDINNLLTEIDIDGDGRVDIAQFVRHMFETSAPGLLAHPDGADPGSGSESYAGSDADEGDHDRYEHLMPDPAAGEGEGDSDETAAAVGSDADSGAVRTADAGTETGPGADAE